MEGLQGIEGAHVELEAGSHLVNDIDNGRSRRSTEPDGALSR